MKVKQLFILFGVLMAFAACSSTTGGKGDGSAVTLSTPRYDGETKTATLTWTACTDEHFTSYKVYRDNKAGVDESSTLLATIADMATTSYEDSFNEKPSEYYYYKIYVERPSGASGSNEVILTGLYILRTSFGAEGSDNGEFSYPGDVAVDNDGNIYVADTDNNRIQKFDPDGNYLTQWGQPGPGDGQFNTPYSIEFAPDGKLYVGDNENDRVQIFDTSGTFVDKVNVNDAADSHISSDGHIYAPSFVDSVIKTFDSSLTPGADIGSPGSGDGQFNSPWDVAASPDETKLYVLDYGNLRVEIFQSNGTYVDEFGTPGTDPGEFDDCWGMAVDTYGYVYVTDWSEGMVQIYDENGNFIEEFQIPAAGTGYGIWGLDFDSDNNMYVVDAQNSIVYIYGP
jgi:DNA-binding beta-propeller fold protein YncE